MLLSGIEGDTRMSEQGTIKVYELAKELGIDSISLLDKLKNLNINVKNHMSELGQNELHLARHSLRKGASALGDKSAAAKKAVATKTRKKAVEKKSTEAAAPHSEAAAHDKKATSTIIRRRTKTEGGEVFSSTQTILKHALSTADTEAAHSVHDISETVHTQPTYHKATQTAAETEEHVSIADVEAPVPSQSTADAEPAQLIESEEQVSSPETTSASAHVTTAHVTAPVTSGAVPKSPEISMQPSSQSSGQSDAPIGQTAGLAAKQQASQPAPSAPPKAARPPIILTPRPVAPRRSILKIVEATAPPPRPIIKPAPAPTAKPTIAAKPGSTTTQDKDGFRIIKMNKENLDQMVEEEAAKKRGGARELEIRPEDVRFADYRKKELVFLPKKKKIPVGKEIKQTQITTAKAQKRIVTMQDMIGLQDLANQLSVKATDVIRKLMNMGQMATINQSLDFETATLIANEYQYEVRNVAFNEEVILKGDEQEQEAPEQLKPRPPIVTIMGHVDHGKTTLLDSIREANVAAGEAGGITQHIGAYTVEKNGKMITFIDTPGHEAFSVMRARGANVTDIVILVVSADDGVMPQTREALSHAQAAKVPIIVAVNKIDKPGANPEKIKQALAELNLLSEDWGGETMFVPVSALQKTNIDKLLDAILLQAEVLELKANPDTRAQGTVLEARLEKGRGAVVSVLVRKGTLHVGDPLVAGLFAGKIKAMSDHKGQSVKEAGPAYAVEVLGLEGVPNAGETFYATETEASARDIALNRQEKLRSKTSGQASKMSLDDLFSKIQSGGLKELNIVLKADAFGSVEAIKDSLLKLSTEKVKVKVILAAAGGVTESDVLLASASNALIVGFNVRPETKARQVAESEHVEIKSYSIIYELIEDVKKAMAGVLEKKKIEKFLGRAEVRQTFTVPKAGTIAGSSVIDGKFIRGAQVRLLRDNRMIFEGKLSSLKRFKDDAKEVATGFECGIGIENYNDIKVGDVIEAFQIELVTPELTDIKG